jgi:2',3'-cyclic-nucleotide 2'-phosphodiesterase (5'-nucleotidase family)
MRRQCDVVVLLSHLGYFTDVETAGKFPWFDVILGGHTHKQLKADEPLHNGVLVTQSGGYLQRAAYVTLTVDSGRVTDKRVEYIDVKKFPKKNKVIASLVESFGNSPKFSRVIARAETPFGVKEELGSMICDALKDAYGADVALTNPGGVRLGQLPAGDITVLDVLRFDPFDNKIVVMTLTGKQLLDLMMSCSQRRLRSFPYVSGVQCELTPDDDDATLVKTAKVTLADGKPLKMKQKYRVVTNSYVASTNLSAPVISQTYDDLTHDVIIRYLEKQKTVSYKGVRRLGITQ